MFKYFFPSDLLPPWILTVIGQSVQRKDTVWRREDERHDGRRGRAEKKRGLSSSQIKRDWIGGYHTFNWTSSLCPAGHWKWTTGMCQLALRPSTSPSASTYQPPTICISLSLSRCFSHSHCPGLEPPPLPLPNSRVPSCTPGALLCFLHSLLFMCSIIACPTVLKTIRTTLSPLKLNYLFDYD